jgi:pantoate kinase
MKTTLSLVLAAGAALALAGCVEETATQLPAGSAPQTAAQQACVRDVRSFTGNGDVSVIRSSFSQAGTEVILRVGPTGTWRCIAYSDGTTAGIESMTDEGFL